MNNVRNPVLLVMVMAVMLIIVALRLVVRWPLLFTICATAAGFVYITWKHTA